MVTTASKARRPGVKKLQRELKGLEKDYGELHDTHVKLGQEFAVEKRKASGLEYEVVELKQQVEILTKSETDLKNQIVKQSDALARASGFVLKHYGID